MSKKEHIFATTIRLNTRTPEGSQTVAWLKSRDKKEYPSYSDLITDAVNFFCARRHALQNDPYLETRQKEDDFLRQIEERVEQAIRQAEARGFANALQMLQLEKAGCRLQLPESEPDFHRRRIGTADP